MKDRKFVFVYLKDKQLCTNADEAINFVNSLSFRNSKLICNDNCTKRIKALYFGNISRYPASGYIEHIDYNDERIPGFSDLATTGCSTTRIKFFLALADTLEEHETIYQKRLLDEKQKRLTENQQRIQQREADLNNSRKGWYAVCLTFDRAKFGNNGIYYTECNYSGNIIAESGMNAYNKTIEHLKKSPDVLPDSLFPVAHSNHFWFEFLGVKTDDGYSVEK